MYRFLHIRSGKMWNCIVFSLLLTAVSSIVVNGYDEESDDGFIFRERGHRSFLDKDPLDMNSYFKADCDFILRQRAILKTFHHYRCPSLEEHDDFFRTSQTYNPKDHLNEYGYPELVRRLVDSLEAGTHVNKSVTFSVTNQPIRPFQSLNLILEDAFVRSAPLFYKTMAYLFTRINIPMLYNSVAVVVSSLRTEGYRIPPPFEVFPQLHAPKDIIYLANELDLGQHTREPIYLTTKSGKRLPEPEISPFREDPYISSFHYLWHVDFPPWYNNSQWTAQKDRKGELFLYAHHQIMTRYEAERMASDLSDIDEIDITSPISPGVNPNIVNFNYIPFPPRPSNYTLSEVYYIPREELNSSVSKVQRDLITLRGDLIGRFLIAKNGSFIRMDTYNGAEILGNTLESNLDTLNRQRYGVVHNDIHELIAYAIDPEGKLGIPVSIMEFTVTSMRDPVFYQLHRLVDNIYKSQLDSLPPYLKSDLSLLGVRIESLGVQTLNEGQGSNSCYPPNKLCTYSRNMSWDITNAISGIDNKCSKIREAKVYASIPQLNHKLFNFLLNVSSSTKRRVVVRIFMSPSTTFGNQPHTSDSLRWSFIELDKFPAQLQPGNNLLKRSSLLNANAGAPYSSWAELYAKVEQAYRKKGVLYVQKYARTCGWPMNYFLPRGRPSPNGMNFTLFAMLTDYEQDFPGTDFSKAERLQSLSLCGVAVGRQPDIRQMGFPFDRIILDVDEFFSNQNMARTTVNVMYLGDAGR